MSGQRIRKILADGRLVEQARFIKWETAARDDGLIRNVRGAPFTIFSALAWFVDSNGECFPSTAKLSEVTGYKERMVQYAIRTLIKNGWVSISEKGSNLKGVKKANRYKLLRYVSYGDSWKDVAEIVSESVELEGAECLKN